MGKQNDKDQPATEQELVWLMKLVNGRRLVDRPCKVKVNA